MKFAEILKKAQKELKYHMQTFKETGYKSSFLIRIENLTGRKVEEVSSGINQ